MYYDKVLLLGLMIHLSSLLILIWFQKIIICYESLLCILPVSLGENVFFHYCYQLYV